MKLQFLTLALLGLVFYSCKTEESDNIKAITTAYYQTFNARKNLKKFIAFYSDNIVLEDIINGDRITGKKALSNFFNWENPAFEALDSNTLSIEKIIIQGNNAVIKGHFSKFKWGKSKFEAMHFTTILTFDRLGKISKQVDWINYPATLVNYNKRKNSNDWIE